MPEATLTSKGQVTIPKKIRDELKLHTGDKLHFQTDEKGIIKLRKSEKSIKDRAGSLKEYARSEPVSIEEMNEAVKQKAVERYKRTQ